MISNIATEYRKISFSDILKHTVIKKLIFISLLKFYNESRLKLVNIMKYIKNYVSTDVIRDKYSHIRVYHVKVFINKSTRCKVPVAITLMGHFI